MCHYWYMHTCTMPPERHLIDGVFNFWDKRHGFVGKKDKKGNNKLAGKWDSEVNVGKKIPNPDFSVCRVQRIIGQIPEQRCIQ